METIAYTRGMTPRKNPIGPTGDNVATNVQRLRQEANLTYAELGRMLDAAGRSIPTLGLRKIEANERRVDADDLTALALVLGVSPITLLMPPGVDSPTVWKTGRYPVTDDAKTYTPQQIWEWLRADHPLDHPGGYSTGRPSRESIEFRLKARPSDADMLDQLGFDAESRERRGDDQ